MIKKITMIILSLVSCIFLFSFISAISSDNNAGLVFNYPINYSNIVINETSNNTLLFDGYSVSSLWTYYTGLGNSLWYSITNPLNFINKTQSDSYYYNKTEIDTSVSTQNLSVSNTAKYNYTSFTNLYDFNSILPQNDLGFRAYQKRNATLSLLNAVAPADWNGTEFTSYGFLWASDDVRTNVNNNGVGAAYLGFLFEIQTGESADDLQALNLTWEGFTQARTYRTYVWNSTSNTWLLLGSTKSNTAEVSYSDYITNPTGLVDANGKVYYLVSMITTQSALYGLYTDYISVEAITKSGQINFYNAEFDNQISVKRTSTNAFLVKNADDKTIFQVDTNKEVAVFGNAQSGGSIFADNNAWFKGTIGVGASGEPNEDYIRIEGTTTDNGYGISSTITSMPSEFSSSQVGISSVVEPSEYGNWSDGAEVIASYSAVRGTFSGAFGNSTMNMIGHKIVGAYNNLFIFGGWLRANSVKALEVQPVYSIGFYATNVSDAYGIYAKKSEGGNVNINNETMIYVEKPDIATNNYQVVLNGTGEGSGQWFGGYNGIRVYANNSNDLIIDKNLKLLGNFSAKRPYGMFSSTETQTIAVADTAYPITFNYTEDAYLISNGEEYNFTIHQNGDYKIDISAIMVTDTNNKHVEIWVQKWNGSVWSNIPRSNTKVEIENAGTEQVVAVPFIIDYHVGEKFRLMWASDDAGSQLLYTTNTTYSPETPSVIMTIQKISEITD